MKRGTQKYPAGMLGYQDFGAKGALSGGGSGGHSGVTSRLDYFRMSQSARIWLFRPETSETRLGRHAQPFLGQIRGPGTLPQPRFLEKCQKPLFLT